MKNILFLSDYEDEVEYDAIFERLAKYGVQGITVKPSEVVVQNSLKGTSFQFKGKALSPDLVIGYAYENDLIPAIKLMKLWQLSGVPVVNNGQTLFFGQNKDVSSAVLNAALGIKHLPYFKFNRLPSRDEMISIGFPLVAKPVNGACGRGLVKLANYFEFKEWVNKHISQDLDNYYVQPYIPKLNNEDFRVVVIGYKACYAYSRKGKNGSWITNLMQSGSGTLFEVDELPESIVSMSEKSAIAAGAPFCGVDIALDNNHEPFVIEVNTCPALKISRYIKGALDHVENACAEFIYKELAKHDN
ncbi:MAG: ATP-grasp domain-containing protein [Candidatus Lariskella arthropodorum]